MTASRSHPWPARRSLRIAALLVVGVAATAAAWTLTVRKLVPTYLESTLRSKLARAGFPDARFVVSDAETGRVVLSEVDLGRGAGLEAERVVVDYGLDSLWRRQLHRVAFHDVRVDPAAIARSYRRKPDRKRRGRLLSLPTDVLAVEGGQVVVGGDLTLPVSGVVRSVFGLHITARTRLDGAVVDVRGTVFRHDELLAIWGQASTPAPTATRSLDAAVSVERRGEDTRVAGRVRLRAAALTLPRGDRLIALESLAVDVGGVVDDGRVLAGSLDARAGAVAVDGQALGALRLAIDSEAAALVATASLRDASHDLAIDARLPADLARLERAPLPLSWKATGAVPDALADGIADGITFESSGHGVATLSPRRLEVAAVELTARAAQAGTEKSSLVDPAVQLSGAGHLGQDGLDLRVAGTLRARRVRAAKLRARRVRASLRARVKLSDDGGTLAVELPRLRASRIARGKLASGAVILETPAGSDPARVVFRRGAGTSSIAVDGALALRRPVAVRGPVRARLRSLRATLAGTITADGGRLRAPTDLRVDDLAIAAAKVSVSSLRVHAPLSFDRRRGIRAGATLSLGGATVARDGDTLRGVDARLRLASLAPLRVRGRQRIAWRGGSVDDHELGAGSIAARALPRNVVAVDEVELAVAGGTLAIAPFRVDPERGELDLHARARNLRLSRIAPLVSRDKVTGRGRLAGDLLLHADWRGAPTLEITRAELASDDGRLLVRDRDLLLRYARSHDGAGDLAQRIASALSDFDYDELRLVVSPEGTGPRLVRIDLRGQGARTPQKLDLTINLRGLEELGSRAWRLVVQPAIVTAERNL